jgi:hypothetical protein
VDEEGRCERTVGEGPAEGAGLGTATGAMVLLVQGLRQEWTWCGMDLSILRLDES